MSVNPNKTLRVGIVGWRGMVGSVLLQRMIEEGDFGRPGLDYFFFSTSQAGCDNPIQSVPGQVLDARDLSRLADMDCVLTCQGSDYTREIHPQLRQSGWLGCWIDAASALRLEPDSTLVLDVINRELILERLHGGCRDFIGANCTVSLMMIALWPLLRADLIDWIFAATYQSASGAGAAGIDELLSQMSSAGRGNGRDESTGVAEHPVLQRARSFSNQLLDSHHSDSAFSAPLCANAIAWIDASMPQGGQSREEWKAEVECNAILNRSAANKITIEGTCVRVPVLRCHSQSLLIRLKKDLSALEAGRLLADNPWVDMVDNNPHDTARALHPLVVSGSLTIKVGRLRQTFAEKHPGRFLQIFTVGDQLLWGAAEPLRRMLRCWAVHTSPVDAETGSPA